MFEKLSYIAARHAELEGLINTPEIINDQQKFRDYCKEHSSLTPIVEKYAEYKAAQDNIAESRDILSSHDDAELHDLARMELEEAQERLTVIQGELRTLLLPKDPNDDKSVIIEIRGGAGGDEAALFAGDLLRMYTMYAESKRWRFEMLSLHETELGGIKEVSFELDGAGAYSRLKYESGVHRVQRVPSTESSGRIHTSTVTVAVLPEAEEVEVEINPNDLRIDIYRSGGAGGQHVNTTDSAIRITHIPTGTIVVCQDERSQHKNKDKAMKILRSRLYEQSQRQQTDDIAQQRKSQVGTGDRSERIRTYNFPQGRVTDHRIGLSLNKIDTILNGALDDIIDPLTLHFQALKLAEHIS